MTEARRSEARAAEDTRRQSARNGAARASTRRDARSREGPARAQPRKAREIQLPARASVRELAHAAIAEGRAHFVHNARGLLREHDAELVHQARVALRRLRVFARVFRSRIGRARAARLTQQLRWLFEILGELRDLQVFQRASAPRASGAAGFEARLAQRLASADRALDAALASPRFTGLCDELASLERDLAAAGADKRARRWLARRLDARRRRALRCFEAVLRKDVKELHNLRKQLKKLRYTAELARALRPKRKQEARTFLHALRELQQVLGALVDGDVARALLRSTRAPRALRAQLEDRIASRRARELAGLEAHFQRFADAPPFWR